MSRSVFAAMALSVALVASTASADSPTCPTGTTGWFCDDFEGSALDTSKWTWNGIGSVTVAGGWVSLRQGPSTAFPYVRAANTFPASGDFDLTVRFRYDFFGGPGVSFNSVAVLRSDGSADHGPDLVKIHGNWSEGARVVSPCGKLASLGSAAGVDRLLDVKLRGTLARYYINGLSIGSCTITSRPTAVYMGNPVRNFPGGDWTDVSFSLIRVGPPNDPPVAGDDAATTRRYRAVTIPVLANDSDPEGQPLRITSVSAPAHGSAALNADGTITYTPGATFDAGDSFTYTVADPYGATDTAVVTVSDDRCGEDGIGVLRASPLDGAASGIVHETIEPAVAGIGPDLADVVHTINCTAVVPAEREINALTP